MSRWQKSASRLIGHFSRGQRATFRRYTMTNATDGTTTPGTSPAETVKAAATVSDFREGERDGIKQGDRKMTIEAKPFTSQPLSNRWTVEVDGLPELPLVGDVAGARPDGAQAYYVAQVRAGGRL